MADKSIYGVAVYVGDEVVRQYAVKARSEAEATDLALAYVTDLLGVSVKDVADLDGEPDDELDIDEAEGAEG